MDLKGVGKEDGLTLRLVDRYVFLCDLHKTEEEVGRV